MEFVAIFAAGVLFGSLISIGSRERTPHGYQPKIEHPVDWHDVKRPGGSAAQPPGGGHEPPNRPVDPAKLVLPQGSGELLPRGR